MLYYDPFDTNEEEDFIESERLESRLKVLGWIRRLEEGRALLSPSTSQSIPPTLPIHVTCIQEIQLTLPLELSSLQDLVSAIQESSVGTIQRLCISQWGLSDRGLPILLGDPNKSSATITTRISHLSLTSCGITAGGFYDLLSALAVPAANNGQSLHSYVESLDVSRNNFLQSTSAHRHAGISPHTPPRDLLRYTLTNVLPKCTHLRHLNLSATGRFSSDSMEAVWQGVMASHSSTLNHHHKPFLQSLDVSHNFDSLEHLLQTMLEYVPQLSIRSIILSRGASSSTCLDYTTARNVLERLQLSVTRNRFLEQLGPLSILPLDRESPPDIHEAYAYCRQLLDDLDKYHLRRNQYQRCYLHPALLWKNTDTEGRNGGQQLVSENTNGRASRNSMDTLPLVLEQLVGRRPRHHRTNSKPSLLQKYDGPPPLLISRHSYSLAYWILQETCSHWATSSTSSY